MHELARLIFRARQSSSFLDKRRVQVHAGFHALRRQRCVSRKPANVVADPATTSTTRNGPATPRLRIAAITAQQFVHPRPVLELFGEKARRRNESKLSHSKGMSARRHG